MRRTEDERLRGVAFAAAYRMLALTADAEDVAQDTMLKWGTLDQGPICDRERYVARIAINLSIDRLNRERRERRLRGDWLPEPASDAYLSDMGAPDDLAYAVLVLLQELTSLERAVFILRASFDCDYADIAGALDRSPEACRKIYSRARAALAKVRGRVVGAGHASLHEDMLGRLVSAIEAGDVSTLVGLLADDVVARGDSGGRGPALKRPLIGAERVAKFLLAWGPRRDGMQVSFQRLNRAPAIVLHDAGAPVLAVLALGELRIDALFAIADPRKLSRIAARGRWPRLQSYRIRNKIDPEKC